MTSSSVDHFMITITGPKCSSRMIRIVWFTSTSTVGSQKSPLPGLRRPPTRARAPDASASLTSPSMMSSWRGIVMAPMSWHISSGGPCDIDLTRATTAPTNAS
eukprot:Amastigsp_a339951_77.p6 type:complete len:103 gc:universal Amastigsp_a339951_77:1214-906(-)